MHVYRLGILVAIIAVGCGDTRSGSAPPRSGARDAGPTPAAGGRDPAPNRGGAAAAPKVARGAELHAKYCALCHGRDARGYAADNAPSLVNETFLASASDDFFAGSIERGRPGTPMAGYGQALGGPLSDGDIADLIQFYRQGGPPPVALPTPVGGVAARGAPMYAAMCQRCHGDETTRVSAPHLANPTFLALASDGYLAHAIAAGRPGTPMDAYGPMFSAEQIADLVAFLRSRATRPAPPPPAPSPGPTPDDTPIVMNPRGRAPKFSLRDDRFVAAADVAQAVADKRRMVIIDARPPSDWARERIPGALSIPYYELSGLARVPNDGTWVIAYCACPHHASGIVVDELRKRGYRNTAVLDEGVLVWGQRGYPVVGTPGAPSARDPGHTEPHGHDHSGHDHAH